MRQDDVSDETLMAAVISGDDKALEVLYDRYAAQVRGLALRMLRERSAAEEVVQETFWRVWSRGKSFDRGRGPFRSWMFTIAHHLAIDAMHRHKAQRQAELNESWFEHITNPSTRTDEVSEAVWLDERRSLVRAAVDKLPAEQAEIILLAYYQGLSRQEIAETTDTPLGTVHSRARLAMDKLRHSLRGTQIKER